MKLLCKKIPTDRFEAYEDEVAKTVVMPIDAVEAKYIAQNYLTNVICINTIDYMYSYTGYYKGVRISVIPSGPGAASTGNYSFELFNYYNVKNIIKMNLTGALAKHLELKDIVVGLGVSAEKDFSYFYKVDGHFSPVCGYNLLRNVISVSERDDVPVHYGGILSAKIVFNNRPKVTKGWQDMGILAVEWGTAILYLNAARSKKNAISICCISDKIYSDEICSPTETKAALDKLINFALDVAILDA